MTPGKIESKASSDIMYFRMVSTLWYWSDLGRGWCVFLNCRSVCEPQNPQNHRVDMKQKKSLPIFVSVLLLLSPGCFFLPTSRFSLLFNGLELYPRLPIWWGRFRGDDFVGRLKGKLNSRHTHTHFILYHEFCFKVFLYLRFYIL